MHETSGAEGLVGGLFGVVLAAAVVALVVVPYWRLWSRTGHSGAWALLVLVPLANVISLWGLAFKRWPALDGVGERRP
jgi:hypothetical protein